MYECMCVCVFILNHLSFFLSIFGDGKPAEDGKAPAGVHAGRLGAAQAARAQRAAQVALPVRQRVRGAWRGIEDRGLGQPP